MFPEMCKLPLTPQNPQHHPEGDVWKHTLLVVDFAAEIKYKLPKEDWLILMYAALLHDIGKPACLDKETLSCHGHEVVGLAFVKVIMHKLTTNTELVNQVCALIKAHMQPFEFLKTNVREGTWKRLYNRVNLECLGLLCWADKAGKLDDSAGFNVYWECHKRYKDYQLLDFSGQGRQIPKKLDGHFLIKLGYKSGPELGRIIKDAYEIQLDKEYLGKWTLWWKAETATFFEKIRIFFSYWYKNIVVE